MPPGAAMKIVVSDRVHLSEVRASDKDALICHLNDRDIYDRTLRIPFPYTAADADQWLDFDAKLTIQQGRSGPLGHTLYRRRLDRRLWVRRLPGREIAPSRAWLLAGEAILGPRHHDRRGPASVPARLAGVRPGEDHRPRLHAQPGVGPCPGKVRLSGRKDFCGSTS